MTMRPDVARLVAVLGNPATAQAMDEAQWSALIATARSANLLGALAERLKDAVVSTGRHAQRHLDGALQLSTRQHQSVLWDAHQLQAALAPLQIPVLLLKGAAYVISEHAVARGRLFGDIDFLVPREALGDVENRLMLGGWVSAKTGAYDQRYYREWMHELPPTVHMRRGTVLDVHHTILPLTARNAPDPDQIIARAVPVAAPSLPMMRVPCPEDLMIHSVTHLVHEGELHNGLRDLCDIDCMLHSIAREPGFWDRFAACAAGNDLAWPVWFGLNLTRHFFGTTVPDSVLAKLSPANPSSVRPRWLKAVYVQTLLSANDAKPEMTGSIARWLVYVRAHSLRMPWLLLARHLTIKAWAGWRGDLSGLDKR